MLKWVHDKVLQPSTIVWAFAACGMWPFDFAASYAYKQVPPPKGAIQVDQEDEWTDIILGDDNREGSVFEAKNEVLSDMVTTSATESGLRHSSHSSSHSYSQNNSHSSTPDSQSSHTHAEHLRGINTWLALLTLDATPCCIAALCKEAINTTRHDAAHDGSTATLVNIIQLRNQVIKKQNTQQILDKQLHDHLKIQLANRDHPWECGGGALKHGYGALDAEALNALEAEAAEKKAEEEERQRQKQQEKEERQCWKDEVAAAKATRAAETAQQKLDWLAEKKRKADERAVKVAEKAVCGIAYVAGRGHGHGRGRERGIGQGQGQVWGGRGGAKPRVPKPFPIKLSSESSGSNTGDNENLTNSGPRTPFKHLQLYNSSNNNIDNDNHQGSGSDDLSQDDPPRSHLITNSPMDLRATEASTSEGNSTRPQCNIHMPLQYMQGKFWDP